MEKGKLPAQRAAFWKDPRTLKQMILALAVFAFLWGFTATACYAADASVPDESDFRLDTKTYTAHAGTQYQLLARMDSKSKLAPRITSSDESVVSVSVGDKNDPRGYLYLLKANKTGAATITVANSAATQTVSVSVVQRDPLNLDTQKCSTYLGNVYYFLAETGTDDTELPTPVSSNPKTAKVEFVTKRGVGTYLFRVTALALGTADVGAELFGDTATFPLTIVDSASVSGVKPLLQNPELPSGCEVTALTALLNDHGYPVGKMEIAEKYLKKDSSEVVRNGKLYLANPYEIFVGDPKTNRFGCFAQVITDTANRYLSAVKSDKSAKNISGSTPLQLYHYVSNDIPVLAWATINMSEPTYNTKWYDKKTGKPIQWIGGEHCVVLTGCTPKTVTVADPLHGMVTYNRSLFEKRYRQVGSQAVLIS